MRMGRSYPHVIPIREDIQRPDRHHPILEHVYGALKAFSEREAAGSHTDEHHALRAVIAFEYLVRDTRQGTTDVSGTQEDL